MYVNQNHKTTSCSYTIVAFITAISTISELGVLHQGIRFRYTCTGIFRIPCMIIHCIDNSLC